MSIEEDDDLRRQAEVLRSKAQIMDALGLARQQLRQRGLEARIQDPEFVELTRQGELMLATGALGGNRLWNLKLDRLIEKFKKETQS